MKLSGLQIRKVSSYLLDISKLVFGATVIPLFVPGNSFGIFTFISGVIFTGLFFTFGLTLLKNLKT